MKRLFEIVAVLLNPLLNPEKLYNLSLIPKCSILPIEKIDITMSFINYELVTLLTFEPISMVKH